MASAVKQLALSRGLVVAQPARLGASQADEWRAARPDAIVVAAYGVLLPPEFLNLAPHGALNIHASLLPRWRGAAPIQRALLAGDPETGISIMRMDAGLDTGPVLARHPLPIDADDDAGSLHDKLAALGADAIVKALTQLEAGNTSAIAQPAEGVTYARKIGRDDAASELVAAGGRARARDPRAAAIARRLDHAARERIKIWRARTTAAGRVRRAACSPPEIRWSSPRGDARSPLPSCNARAQGAPAAEFLRGWALSPGARLE
jgi:methionyl-tRNA formyltransferase